MATDAAAASGGKDHKVDRNDRLVILASSVGTVTRSPGRESSTNSARSSSLSTSASVPTSHARASSTSSRWSTTSPVRSSKAPSIASTALGEGLDAA